MRALQTRVMLRERIRTILREDDYGGFAAGESPYGMHFASDEQLYKIFIKPFADVVGVAAGKTKELSQKGQTLLKTTFVTIATTLIPGVKDKYGEIFSNEKEMIDKIRSDYSDVYGATWEAFADQDVAIAAFMFRPDLFITQHLVRKAPKAAAKLLSVLSGGTLDGILQKNLGGSGKGRGESSILGLIGSQPKEDGPGYYEGVIREDDGEDPAVKKLAAIAANKKVRAVLTNSQEVQKLAAVGQAMVKKTLGSVVKQAQGVLGAKSLDDLQKITGKQIPGMDKLGGMEQQARQKAEQLLIASIKKTMKEFYVKQLEEQAKKAVDAGVPKDHPFIKSYLDVISKIKAM